MNKRLLRRSWRASVARVNTRKGHVIFFVLLIVFSVTCVTRTRRDTAPTEEPHLGDVSKRMQLVRPPSAYPHLDDLDPLPPRVGENFITYGAFLDCLAARLRVDRHQKRELPIRNSEPHFPYMMSSITFEISELKAFTCNVTVPIKHFMIVHNYNLSSVKEFIDATASVFAFTDRLQIRRFPRNRGYAGAINEAMRHALTFPFDEVPFFFMSNYDVRFSRGLWEEALPRIRISAFAGKPLLEAFKAEVAAEPNEHTPPHFRDVPLRSTGDNNLLYTSPSLPDRVRYMSKADREAVFKGLHGWYFPDEQYQRAVWGLSRLGLEMAGFFDENCFPAYWEDLDYEERMDLLGLKPLYVLPNQTRLRHLENNLMKTEKAFAKMRSLGDTLAFLRGVTEVVHFTLSKFYGRGKPMMVNMNVSNVTAVNTSLLPPDAWVLNERRRLAIEELMRMTIRFHSAAGEVANERRDLQTVIASAPPDRQEGLNASLVPTFNAAELYREGNALRSRRINL